MLLLTSYLTYGGSMVGETSFHAASWYQVSWSVSNFGIEINLFIGYLRYDNVFDGNLISFHAPTLSVFIFDWSESSITRQNIASTREYVQWILPKIKFHHLAKQLSNQVFLFQLRLLPFAINFREVIKNRRRRACVCRYRRRLRAVFLNRHKIDNLGRSCKRL